MTKPSLSGLMETATPTRRAAVLSCILHAAFLLSLLSVATVQSGAEPAAPSLTVELFAPPTPEPVVAEQTAPPTPTPAVTPTAKPSPKPQTKPVSKTPVSQTSISDAPAAPLMTAPSPAPAAAPVQSAVTETATALGRQAARDATLKDFTEQVWSRVMRYRPARVKFPGMVSIRFTLDQDGRLLSAELDQSSGSAFLDQAGLDAVHRAAPFPAPPPDLTMPLEFIIPFQFR